jgi:hypothetical protein
MTPSYLRGLVDDKEEEFSNFLTVCNIEEKCQPLNLKAAISRDQMKTWRSLASGIDCRPLFTNLKSLITFEWLGVDGVHTQNTSQTGNYDRAISCAVIFLTMEGVPLAAETKSLIRPTVAWLASG